MPSRTNIALPVLTAAQEPRRRARMGRRRTIALVVVHLLVLAHVWHYFATGTTLTPLEPSEAGYSIESGAINAGAIFLLVLILSTLLFGRFFCGWACHVVAYQDLARWMLRKVGITPRPVRIRMLMLVPLFAVVWLYGRPLYQRLSNGGSEAGLSLHLTTDDFWGTFPGVTIGALTFLICGFVIVYFLGSKGFCTYGCPYGMLFGISDRVAPGRIRVNENCDHSGECTKNCSSNVNVAREVALYGMVVDPNCLKCMDCVAGCPNDALSFGFRPASDEIAERGRTVGLTAAERKIARVSDAVVPPSSRHSQIAKQLKAIRGRLNRFFRRGRHPARHFDLSWWEEGSAALLFIGLFWVVYDLYRVVPFLMALGICVMVVYLLLIAARLLHQGKVETQGRVLRKDERLTRWGWGWLGATAVVLLLTGHSAAMQWQTRRALSRFEEAMIARVSGDEAGWRDATGEAQRHLEFLDQWGLGFVRGSGRMQGEIARWNHEPQEALPHFDRELTLSDRNRDVWMFRGLVLMQLGRAEEGRENIERAFESSKPRRSRFLHFDWEVQRMIRERVIAREHARPLLELHLEQMRRATLLYPTDGEIALQLSQMLAGHPFPGLRDPGEALRVAEQACAANGRSHANLLSLLAYLYSTVGRHEDALTAAEDSLRRARESGQEKIAAEMEQMIELQYRPAMRH